MTQYFYITAFIIGAIIGSFLNVVIYRMHTGRSLSGRSHCMSCGKTLSWYELFPVFSYLFLRGSCRGCSSYIPYRYLLVETLTGGLFVTMWHLFSFDSVLLILNLILTVIIVLIVVYDIRHTIIPDELTIALCVLALGFVGYEYLLTRSIALALSHFGSGLGAAVFFWGLWYISKGKWIGLGDAKLAFPLGVIVGVGGVFSMVVFSFWIGALVAISFLGIQKLTERGKVRLHFLSSPLTIKSEVPFAPFLVLGFLVVHLLHADTFDITYRLFFTQW